MLVSPSFLARGARARAGASLLVLAAIACDTNRPSSDPATAAASLNGVGMVLDFPTVALTLGMAGSTLHAVRPTMQGMDTVAAAWHSTDEQIVSVDNAGHLTARAAGSALVWARAGRDSVSSAVTVSPSGASFTTTAATVAVRPAVATLAVGTPTHSQRRCSSGRDKQHNDDGERRRYHADRHVDVVGAERRGRVQQR